LQAVTFINLFQALAIAYVISNKSWIEALIMNALLIFQLPLQGKLSKDPKRFAPWYCAAGIPLFCWSMLASALALRFGGF
jgi:chlorophyll synthase